MPQRPDARTVVTPKPVSDDERGSTAPHVICSIPQLAYKSVAVVESALGQPDKIDRWTAEEEPSLGAGENREYSLANGGMVRVWFTNGRADNFQLYLPHSTPSAEEAIAYLGIDVQGVAPDFINERNDSKRWDGTVGSFQFKRLMAFPSVGGRAEVLAHLAPRETQPRPAIRARDIPELRPPVIAVEEHQLLTKIAGASAEANQAVQTSERLEAQAQQMQDSGQLDAATDLRQQAKEYGAKTVISKVDELAQRYRLGQLYAGAGRTQDAVNQFQIVSTFEFQLSQKMGGTSPISELGDAARERLRELGAY